MDSMVSAAEVFAPGEYLRDELVERGWTESEFAQIIGRPLQVVSEIVNGKKEITPETAVAIGEAFGTSAELWLNLQMAHRLSALRSTQRQEQTAVARRARLRSLVPVRELQKRRWLPDTPDLETLENSVRDLLGISDLSEAPDLGAAARRASTAGTFTPQQNAWVARVRGLGTGQVSNPFDPEGLRGLAERLVSQIHDPFDLAELPTWLAEYGIALVIELPLKNSKIDGCVCYAPDGHPIIGLSTRGDRMDSFIFTLLHEIAHLLLEHVRPGDVQIDEDVVAEGNQSGEEAAANRMAAEWVLPQTPRISGRPSIRDVLTVARANGVHPSFVIGRLQRDGQLGWNEFRRYIPKVRPFVDSDSGDR